MSTLPIKIDAHALCAEQKIEADAAEADAKLQARRVREALEAAVETGSLKPWQALEAAAHYDVKLLSWVHEKHEAYVAANAPPRGNGATNPNPFRAPGA